MKSFRPWSFFWSLLWAFLFFTSCPAWAGVKVIGNGGDPVALEFSAAADEALSDLAMHASSYPELAHVSLSDALRGIKILISDALLPVEEGGFFQNSVAVNDARSGTILVNRAAWKMVSNQALRKALVLHELLGLKGIESTGNYPISQRYLLAQEPYCSEATCRKPAFYVCKVQEVGRGYSRETASAVVLVMVGKVSEVRIGGGEIVATLSLEEKDGVSIQVGWWKKGQRLGRGTQSQSDFPLTFTQSWESDSEGEPSARLSCRANTAPTL